MTDTSLTAQLEQTELAPETAAQLQQAFVPFIEKMKQWEEKAREIVVTDENDKEGMLKAREARLALREIRVQANKTREYLKRDSLNKGNAIQACYNLIKGVVEPLESHLEKQEKFAEIKEAERKAELKTKRLAVLAQYGADPTEYPPLEELSDEAFAKIETSLETEKQQRIEAEAKAKAEAEAKEKAEAEERARIEAENEKLRKANEEAEAKAAAEREAAAQREAEERAKREAAEKELAEKKAAEEKAAADAAAAEEKRKQDEAAAADEKRRAEANEQYKKWLDSHEVTDEALKAGRVIVKCSDFEGDKKQFTIYKVIDTIVI